MGSISWDDKSQNPQEYSSAKNELSSDEEGCSGIGSTHSKNRRKPRKRKRSEMDSTPFHDFFTATLSYAIDSSYLTSDAENDPRQPSCSDPHSWKRDILESGYYDSDDKSTGYNFRMTPARLKLPMAESPFLEAHDDNPLSRSGDSVEMDSSYYDND